MDPAVVHKVLEGAQSQSDRWPRALDPGYATIDDRSLGSLVDFACRFSSLVNYYGLDNKVAGDWVALFTSDPLVTMASMVATDVDGAERRLARLTRRVRSGRSLDLKHARLVKLFEAALDLPRQIDRWLRGLPFPDWAATSVPWQLNIETTIAQLLAGRLQQIKALDLGAGIALGRPLGLDYSEFSPAWQLDRVAANESIDEGASDEERIDRAMAHVLEAWRPFAAAVAGWAADARPQIVTAFERGGFHQPHVALFVAFAKLFASTQASVNSFPARRADFYFRRVLRDHNRPAVPDTAYVAFTCAPAKEPLVVTVPARTPLAAGKDAAGRAIVFESQDDIRVTSAALARVSTLRVVSGPLAANGADLTVTERVLAHVVTPDRAGPGGWATFGSVDDEPADLGFTISSPALALAGGARTMALEFRCAPAGTRPADLLAHLSKATGNPPAVVFDTLLAHAFDLSVSTADGWLPVGPYVVDRVDEHDLWVFRLGCTLGKDAPAVAALPGPGVASDLPSVRADLRQNRVTVAGPSGIASVFPLSVLEGLTVTAVDVHVDVVGLAGVRVANTDGDIDQSKPFAAFGALPTTGSYLRVRHAELFAKPVSRLALDIKWFDLPVNYTGFRGYYRGYVIDGNGVARTGLFDNQVFRASVAVERPGTWAIATPAGDGDRHLFRTEDRTDGIPEADGVLAKSTRIDDLVVQKVAGPAVGYEPSDGSVRVELTAPPYAFGHSIYQPNMMHAVMANVSSDATCETTCRGEYAVVADARRRTADLLKDVERTWTIARVGQWLSPLYWLTKIAQGVRAAYRWITRALPAHVARRPDPATQSASIVGIRYADSDFRPRRTGPFFVGRAFKHTVTSRLNLTLRTLLDAAHASLEECLVDWQDRFPRAEWQRLRTQLTEARTARVADELAALTALHKQLEAVSGSDESVPDPARQWLVRCEVLLRAATWVFDCEAGCAGSTRMTYWRTVSANLTKCTSALQTLYDTAMKRCRESCPRPRPVPNPPYVPQIEALAVDYAASAPATFSHLLPHGGYRRGFGIEGDPATLVPRFAHAANLYLGLAQVTTPQPLHLYVRLGHNEHDQPSTSPVVWDALVGNQWLRLPASQVADATHGLQRSGIITLTMPDAVAAASTVLSGEYRWLRASTSDAAAVPNTIGIVPHAVKAVRRLSATGGEFERLLPARSIAGFVKPVKGIASVIQPAASFGGRPPETDRGFQTRVGERLRHKDRAILAWDYERLVLEHFPAVSKVLTIAARRHHADDPDNVGPGHVQVVIVPGPDCPDVVDPLTPMASSDTLAEIEQMLRSVTSPFVRLQVLNPLYVRIRVAATIRWRAGEDARVCARRVNTALVDYLSPWRTGAHDRDLSLSEIAAFIRSRHEVESLVTIGLVSDPDDCALSPMPRCVLTSAAEHDIRTFTEAAAAVAGGY